MESKVEEQEEEFKSQWLSLESESVKNNEEYGPSEISEVILKPNFILEQYQFIKLPLDALANGYDAHIKSAFCPYLFLYSYYMREICSDVENVKKNWEAFNTVYAYNQTIRSTQYKVG